MNRATHLPALSLFFASCILLAACGGEGKAEPEPLPTSSEALTDSSTPTSSELGELGPIPLPSDLETPSNTLYFTDGIDDNTIKHEKMNVDYEAFANWDSMDINEKLIVGDEFFAANGVEGVAGINQDGEEMMEWFYSRYVAVKKLALDTSAERNEEIAIMLADTLAMPNNDTMHGIGGYKEEFGTLAYSSDEMKVGSLNIYEYTDGMDTFNDPYNGKLVGKVVHYDVSYDYGDDNKYSIEFQEQFAYREAINAQGSLQSYWFSVSRQRYSSEAPFNYGSKPPITLNEPKDTN
ncbi:hypothetical protein [Glutamicibacter sp. NPDC087344]|uniref:hypothetical protein n=1 Tax=Glutamicibacter sp. NPDC087344 TaxID=3363994 RepID=UPI0038275FCA